MSTKFVRFVAALAVMVSIFGNSGVVRADHGAPPISKTSALDIPALSISPASSLGVQFVHIATAANIYASYTTIIDNPLTNGDPNAKIIVTPNDNPGDTGGKNDPHPIGVMYSSGKWSIFNKDIAAMPLGAAFNVIIPTANVFVQNTTIAGTSTNIDNALTDSHPNAMILVTPNYNPGGACPCVSANFHIGVKYSGTKWSIFTQDNSLMPLNAAFNVFVLPAGAGVFVHTATVGNTTNVYSTYIDNPLTNGNPNAIIFVTQNWNPSGIISGTNDDHPIGVFYNGTKWEIYNQDLVTMSVDASFNVLVLVPVSDIFVHTATASNSAGAFTKIDNALTNGHANAIIFTTPNLTPGGVSGANNNHNIGVTFTDGVGAILNQDGAAVPLNAAFNVLVPNPDASVFVHKATAANILSHSTIIDYPLVNGNPNAIFLVTLNFAPGGVCPLPLGCLSEDHPIGVFYDGSNWRIYNQDSAAMPVDAAFNVFVPGAGAGIFVHTATLSNSVLGYTYIDSPLTNGNPNAKIIVTPNWNPGGVGGTNNNHPIGVFYDTINHAWAIFNQDGGTMSDGAAFNVYVFSPPTVNTSVRASGNPTNTASVDFTVTFSESVTGVDASDFNLTTSGVSGAAVSGVSGSGSVYTVSVNTGSGSGTIRLDVVNDGTIKNAALNPLGAGFTSGETYNVRTTTFIDVPTTYWAWQYIERLYSAGITGGCSVTPLNYCPDSTVTRAQMAVFLLKGMHGSIYTPPAVGASSGFSDVPVSYWAAAWIKQLAAEGITGGCGTGIYCPDATVTRAQMAVFLLKAEHGSSYSPPAATGVFTDVPVGYWADKWIEQLAVEGITGGCGTGVYCPDSAVTRAQMAAFLVKTFNLP